MCSNLDEARGKVATAPCNACPWTAAEDGTCALELFPGDVQVEMLGQSGAVDDVGVSMGVRSHGWFIS